MLEQLTLLSSFVSQAIFYKSDFTQRDLIWFNIFHICVCIYRKYGVSVLLLSGSLSFTPAEISAMDCNYSSAFILGKRWANWNAVLKLFSFVLKSLEVNDILNVKPASPTLFSIYILARGSDFDSDSFMRRFSTN
jgi:hypothetical protein